MCVLDSGIGPGTTSKLILSAIRPGLLVGLDGSVKQLQVAKGNLSHLTDGKLHVVRGAFEFLPFREDTFDQSQRVMLCVTVWTYPDLLQNIGGFVNPMVRLQM